LKNIFRPNSENPIPFEYRISKNTASTEIVVLIHGLGLNSSCWGPFLELLVHHYHVLSYDFRGHGDSPPSDMPITWDLLTRDLYDLLDSLSIRQFHLIGHGSGSNIAIQFAISFPDMVKSLILMSCPSLYPLDLVKQQLDYRKELTRGCKQELFAEYMVDSVTSKAKDSEEVNQIRSAYRQVSLKDYFQIANLVLYQCDLKLFNQVSCNSQFLAGENDPIYHPYLTNFMSYYISKALFFTEPDASNLIFLDQPEITVKWIQSFITKNSHDQRNTAARKTPLANHEEMLNKIRLQVQKFIDSGQQWSTDKPKLKINVVENFQVWLNGKELQQGWSQRSAKRLLVYLAYHPNTTRDQICDDLLPEFDIKNAKNNLRVFLNHLKGLLDNKSTAVLITDKEHITLTADVELDLADYAARILEAVDEKEPSKKAIYCEKVIQTFPWNFLAGIFDPWLLHIREQLEHRILELISWLAQYRVEKRQYEAAAECWKMALHVEKDQLEYYNHIITNYRSAKKPNNVRIWKKMKRNAMQDK
jgi:pimeloyl-ACP methyl ester carboxylesterase/DNA-binding SARP family transcriptional activator